MKRSARTIRGSSTARSPRSARPARARGEGGFDLTIQAMSGIMSVTGEPDGDPVKCGVPVSDFATGLYAAFAITAALREAQQTGQGTHIDVSMFGCSLAIAALQTSEYFGRGAIRPSSARRTRATPRTRPSTRRTATSPSPRATTGSGSATCTATRPRRSRRRSPLRLHGAARPAPAPAPGLLEKEFASPLGEFAAGAVPGRRSALLPAQQLLRGARRSAGRSTWDGCTTSRCPAAPAPVRSAPRCALATRPRRYAAGRRSWANTPLRCSPCSPPTETTDERADRRALRRSR